MDSTSDTSRDEETHLLRRAAEGDPEAWAEVVARYDPRLRRMIRLRFNRRLQGRTDEGDFLQEACLEIHRKLPEYAAEPRLPPYLWVRQQAGLKLAEIHRRHLGTQSRDADRELTLHHGGLPEADSASPTAQLMGNFTSPSQAAVKAELRLQVQLALAQPDQVDHELLALKHFEQLTTAEVAEVFGLSKAGAGHRYV